VQKFIEAIQHAVLNNLRNNRADGDATKISSGRSSIWHRLTTVCASFRP